MYSLKQIGIIIILKIVLPTENNSAFILSSLHLNGSFKKKFNFY